MAFADRWNWGPDQVDALPLWLYDRLLAVAVIKDEVQEERRRRESPDLG